MRAHIVAAARALARRWPTVAAVVHRELDAVAQALRDPRLDELARLIEDGRLAEARALLAALSEDLEPGHPDLVGAVWEFNMAEQAARKSTPVEVSVYRPAFNEPHGTQRLVGVAGAPMSHEEATRTIGEILDAAQSCAMPVATWAPASPSGGAGASWDDNPPDDCEAPESHPECPCVRPEEELPSPRPTFADGQRWRAGIGKYTTGRGVMPGTIEVFDECGMVSDVFQNGAEAPRGWYLIEEAPAKPSRVLPGQVWRCVGVDGELEVLQRGPRRVKLTGEVIAREADMLGLKEWTFVSGPR